jgi:hypothetical protein
MLIAKEKKKSNIAEYVLYMWQVEDLIRVYGFDMERIEKNIVSQYTQPEKVKQEIRDWYTNLIVMMYEERIQKTGHLQFVKNTINEMNDLHLRLLNDLGDEKYKGLYRLAEPNIQEFNRRSVHKAANDIETCFNGLYALLMLRLQKKNISAETNEAMSTFSSLLAYLSKRYKDMEEGKLEL